MKNFNLQEFNMYLNLANSLDTNIQIGKYNNQDLLKKSENIAIDFYRVSLKKGFDDKSQTPIKKHHSIIFINSPDNIFNWETDKNWEGFFIQFTKDWLNKHTYFDQSFLNYGLHEALYIQEEDLNEIQFVYSNLFKHYQDAQWTSSLFLSYIQVLFELIEKLYKKQFNIEKNTYHRLVQEFYALLNSYHEIPQNALPSVAKIAEKLNTSPNYLGDVIKYFTNNTASNIIQKHTLNKAKKLLLETNMPISDIAYYLGYEYPGYFSRIFKKNTNVSPKKFRNQ